MEHGEIVFGLFSPTNKQVAEAVEPRVGALYDPAPGFLTRLLRLCLLPSGPDVGCVAQFGYYFAHLVVVVARVQAQVLVVARRPLRVASGFGCREQATQRALGQLHVMPVCPLHYQPYRDAPRLGQEAALDAAFAAVRGVGARFFPHPAALCAANRRGPSSQN